MLVTGVWETSRTECDHGDARNRGVQKFPRRIYLPPTHLGDQPGIIPTMFKPPPIQLD